MSEPTTHQSQLPPPLQGSTRHPQSSRGLLPVQMSLGIEGHRIDAAIEFLDQRHQVASQEISSNHLGIAGPALDLDPGHAIDQPVDRIRTVRIDVAGDPRVGRAGLERPRRRTRTDDESPDEPERPSHRAGCIRATRPRVRSGPPAGGDGARRFHAARPVRGRARSPPGIEACSRSEATSPDSGPPPGRSSRELRPRGGRSWESGSGDDVARGRPAKRDARSGSRISSTSARRNHAAKTKGSPVSSFQASPRSTRWGCVEAGGASLATLSPMSSTDSGVSAEGPGKGVTAGRRPVRSASRTCTRATEVWLSTSQAISSISSSGTREKSATVRVSPSQPI